MPATTTTRGPWRRVAGSAVAALAAALTLTCCQGGPATVGEALKKNDAGWVVRMVEQQHELLSVTGQVPSRSTNPAVRRFAATLDRDNRPELRTMVGWLKSWGIGEPSGSTGAYPERGARFDAHFLHSMRTSVLKDSYTIAARESRAGTYAPARQLAGVLTARYAAELTQARDLQKRYDR
jgi:uncharacterized protein (DUF305 family)